MLLEPFYHTGRSEFISFIFGVKKSLTKGYQIRPSLHLFAVKVFPNTFYKKYDDFGTGRQN